MRGRSTATYDLLSSTCVASRKRTDPRFPELFCQGDRLTIRRGSIGRKQLLGSEGGLIRSCPYYSAGTGVYCDPFRQG